MALQAAGFVSYGGVAAGTRAVQQLKQVITTLKMFPLFDAVNIPFQTQFIDGTACSAQRGDGGRGHGDARRARPRAVRDAVATPHGRLRRVTRA